LKDLRTGMMCQNLDPAQAVELEATELRLGKIEKQRVAVVKFRVNESE
jgi:hypothetical protein